VQRLRDAAYTVVTLLPADTAAVAAGAALAMATSTGTAAAAATPAMAGRISA
jgi:hypothetical protein